MEVVDGEGKRGVYEGRRMDWGDWVVHGGEPCGWSGWKKWCVGGPEGGVCMRELGVETSWWVGCGWSKWCVTGGVWVWMELVGCACM